MNEKVKMTIEEKRKIIELYERDNKTIKEIQKSTGRCRSTIKALLEKVGLIENPARYQYIRNRAISDFARQYGIDSHQKAVDKFQNLLDSERIKFLDKQRKYIDEKCKKNYKDIMYDTQDIEYKCLDDVEELKRIIQKLTKENLELKEVISRMKELISTVDLKEETDMDKEIIKKRVLNKIKKLAESRDQGYTAETVYLRKDLELEIVAQRIPEDDSSFVGEPGEVIGIEVYIRKNGKVVDGTMGSDINNIDQILEDVDYLLGLFSK